MPPSRSEYQPLAQSIEEEEDVAESLHASSTRTLRRPSRPAKIDLTKLDTAFKRWTESIAQKVKRKKKVEDNSKKEIIQSIFGPPVESQGMALGPVKTLDHKQPMSQADFEILVQSVRRAISEGIHPKMITKGSSGSYFARAKVEGRVQTVAVFKPKDEEPYGRLNPKTTKWLHRQFRWLIPFGRACLIPNLSYISEAAASLLDRRLDLNIVPRTELVSLSSPAFFYDWIDRTAAKKGKPLPEKIGSMQYFLHGYTDASEFLRKHPWPGRAISDTFDDDTHRTGNFTKRCLSTVKVVCGRTGDDDDQYDDAEGDELFDPSEAHEPGRPFYWSQALQQSFRDELEKLVILDYLMLNTDRGADNYMIKYCEAPLERAPVDVAPTRSTRLEMPQMSELRRIESAAPSPSPMMSSSPSLGKSDSQSDLHKPYTKQPHIHIAAIDNSLSFPWEHPHGWRAYTYGWLYLPVSIIGRPFGEKTRQHFLALLTSKEWWEETTFQLRKLFAVDPDFHPKMFNRQLAVIKGQAWNIVQSLKHIDEGPLELTRRQKVLVWDDEVEIVDEVTEDPFDFNGPLSASSIASLPPLPGHRRAQSASEGGAAPPMRRTSTDALPRPVPFSARHQRVHPGTTGVTVLEHMERLDAVEAGLKRLGSEDLGIPDDEEEMDVADSGSSASKAASSSRQEQPQSAGPSRTPASEQPSSAFSPPARSENLQSVPEHEDGIEEDHDMVALSMSTPQLDDRPQPNTRWTTHAAGRRSFDWMRSDQDQPESAKKRVAIVERLETVDTKPFFSFW
ncbi:hypothetical protein OE88DRAFT_1732997 [Heliocybe sulcata]|uniref:Phosphatidylinositol 4-kinase n=1 Tax=Heliocybe sulcata TaxID=5364 RepID=A0A5C3NBQ7_9AGAM|nr:hypothetical protein OE88DRAFT_1732997 [Heliocybe sulcata]